MKETKLTQFVGQFHQETFDASNADHIMAYAYMQNHSRQHPTIRFRLEDGHLSVPIMMAERLAAAYLTGFPALTHAVATDVATATVRSMTV